MKRRLLLLSMIAAVFAAAPAFSADEKKPERKPAAQSATFDRDSVLKDAEAFFGKGAGASIGYVHYTPKKTYNPF